MNYRVTWRVEEQADGSGDDVKHGERRWVARGETVQEGESEDIVVSQLQEVLEKAFPGHVMRGTYELRRLYTIEVVAI